MMDIIRRLVIFLIRLKLRVKKREKFYFPNQRAVDDRYFFTETEIMKFTASTKTVRKSTISLNYLLSDICCIVVDETEK